MNVVTLFQLPLPWDVAMFKISYLTNKNEITIFSEDSDYS